ncbi:unnamed protein product [Urochloa humidicola]
MPRPQPPSVLLGRGISHCCDRRVRDGADLPEPVYLTDLCPNSDSKASCCYGVGASSSGSALPSSPPRRNGAAASSSPSLDQARTEPTLGSLPHGGCRLQVVGLAGACFGGLVFVPHAFGESSTVELPDLEDSGAPATVRESSRNP